MQVQQPQTLQEWMADLRLASMHDGGDAGWTPLRYAVLARRVDLAEELLNLGADIEAATSKPWNQFSQTKGSTVLHLACYANDDAGMIQLLLSRGAGPRRTCESKAGLCESSRLQNAAALTDYGKRSRDVH
eukprot:5260245-Prymnesium_polylepis.1